MSIISALTIFYQKLFGNKFQTHNGKDEGAQKENPPKMHGLLKEQNTHHNCARCPYTGPYRIGRTDRDFLDGLIQQYNAQDIKENEYDGPLCIAEIIGLFQAAGKGDLAK
jgi:hypothetical protein